MRAAATLTGAAAVLALCALHAPPAAAQIESREGIALQNEILQLRNEVEQLRASGVGGGGVSPDVLRGRPPPQISGDLTAQLLARVQALEDQVRELRGRQDETENQVQRQGADLSKQIGDLNFRLQGGGAPGVGAVAPDQGAVTAPVGAPPPPPFRQSPPPTPLGQLRNPAAAGAAGLPGGPGGAPPRTPERALQEGNAALARRDYAAAEADAREVLANRTSPRAGDAQFLLAQALAGQRNYPQAAIAYDDSYNRNKRGPRAPDSLLGLASALVAIGEKRAACDTMSKLDREFPRERPDLHERETALRGRADCR